MAEDVLKEVGVRSQNKKGVTFLKKLKIVKVVRENNASKNGDKRGAL